MADYYPLIAKAVSGLDKSTGETRRALYDRARTALLAQLRGVEPALSEPDITRERLALEEAIRKVENEVAFQRADAARRLRGEPLPPRPEPDPRAEAPADASHDYAETPRSPDLRGDLRGTRQAVVATDDEAETEDLRSAIPLSVAATARAPAPETRRTERWSHGPSLSDNGLRSFRDGAGETGPADDASVRTYPTVTDDFGRRYEQSPAQSAGQNQVQWAEQHDDDVLDQGEEHLLEQPPRLSPRDVARPPSELMAPDDGRGRGQSFPRIVRPDRMPAPERAQELPSASAWSAPRNTNRIVAISVIGLLVLGLAGVAYWFGSDMMASMRGTASRNTDQAGPAENATRAGKIGDRAPSATGASEGALVAQKVVLYEEDPSNPTGTQYGGAAVWRTEQMASAPGQKPDVVVRAEIEIPEQKLSVRLSLRRNDDKQLPASHTVEIMFTMPPDFAHGGIDKIPGIMMKQGETTRGVALSGVAVKVTNNYFLIGLSSVDADMARNVQLLKERSWFDIPVVYGDGKRALIAIEKGIPGEHAFSEAFAAWEQ
jgi:hypothetical protein